MSNPHEPDEMYLEDELTGHNYPYELARELHYPGRGCVLGSSHRNRFMLNFTNSCCGIVGNGSSVHCPVIQPDEFTDIFRCRMNTDYEKSHGVFKIKYPTGKISGCSGIGTHCMKCDCLSGQLLETKADWESIMSLKYEDKYAAACRVGGFFGQKLVYYPLWIQFDENGEDGVNRPDSEVVVSIFYHMIDQSVHVHQCVKFLITKKGCGWSIKDPLNRNSRLQSKACKECNHSNVKLGQRFRMMFGLDCGKHCLCELCVYAFFTAKQIKSASTPDTCMERYCWECCMVGGVSPLANTVTVSFDGCSKMRAPQPVGYFGLKAVVSRPMMEGYLSFYLDHIHFAVCAQNAVECELRKLKQELAKIVYRIGGQRDGHYLGDIATQHEDSIRNHDNLRQWLSDREPVFGWAKQNDARYPKVFLEMDRGYYSVHLNKSEFYVKSHLARMSIPTFPTFTVRV